MRILIKQIISGYWQWIKYYTCKTYRDEQKEIAQKRIAICESCQFFWKPGRNCIICGCFMDVKTKMHLELDENGKSINGCSEKKW